MTWSRKRSEAEETFFAQPVEHDLLSMEMADAVDLLDFARRAAYLLKEVRESPVDADDLAFLKAQLGETTWARIGDMIDEWAS